MWLLHGNSYTDDADGLVPEATHPHVFSSLSGSWGGWWSQLHAVYHSASGNSTGEYVLQLCRVTPSFPSR